MQWHAWAVHNPVVGGAKLRYNIVNSAVIEKSPVSKKSVIICQPDIK